MLPRCELARGHVEEDKAALVLRAVVPAEDEEVRGRDERAAVREPGAVQRGLEEGDLGPCESVCDRCICREKVVLYFSCCIVWR